MNGFLASIRFRYIYQNLVPIVQNAYSYFLLICYKDFVDPIELLIS